MLGDLVALAIVVALGLLAYMKVSKKSLKEVVAELREAFSQAAK